MSKRKFFIEGDVVDVHFQTAPSIFGATIKYTPKTETDSMTLEKDDVLFDILHYAYIRDTKK